jgi:uncharacterized protein YbjT (DUF2867 family)
MKVVVVGGTGLIGSKVVAILSGMGHDVVSAAPSTGIDTVTGEGLAAAMRGAEVVVDVANSPSFEDQVAMDFFVTAGRNLTAAEEMCGVSHHVALSVVGTERLQASGYFRAKLAQERQIMASSVPWTLIHATQFFEFLRDIAASASEGSAVRLPQARFQPIAACDVAAAVAEVALAPPANATFEVAGPETFRIDELVARVLEHDRDSRTLIADPDAAYFGIRLNDASLMPGPDARIGATPFEWWIENVPPPSGK